MRSRGVPALVFLVTLTLASALAHAGGRAPEEISPLPAFPGAHDLVVASWDQESGMPDHDVLALARTRDRYLWIGTRRGLSRFDGTRFTAFDNTTVAALPPGRVTVLYEDNDATLWIGTDSGLAKRVGDTFVRVPSEGLTESSIRAIYRDRQGTLWVGTTDGLGRWDGQRFVSIKGPGDAVLALAEDARGRLWAGSYGAFLVDHDQMTEAPSGPSDNWIRAIHLDKAGALWLASESGLMRVTNTASPLPPHRSEIVPFMDDGHSLMVWTIAESRDGTLWIGTSGNGLLRFDGRQLVTAEIDGLQGDPAVKSLIADDEGSVWMGTAEALVRLREPLARTLTRRDGLSSSYAWALLIDQRGAIWAGTQGGGLNQVHNGKVRVYGRRDGLRGEIVVCLGLQRDGTVWAASRPDGLARIKDGRLEDMTIALGLAGDRVRSIHEDPQGRLWFGTRDRGLVQLVHDRLVPFPQAGSFAGEYLSQISIAADGSLWLVADDLVQVTDGRVTRLDAAAGFIGSIPYMILQEGSLTWIATDEAGLVLLRDGHFTSFQKACPEIMPCVYNVIGDELGYLWLSGQFGLQRVRRQDLLDVADGKRASLTLRSFDKRDGLASTEFNSYCLPGAAHGSDGRLWFPTAAGLVSIDPREVVLQREAPPVRIERIVADDAVWPSPQAVALPAGVHRLQIDYAALALDSPDRTRFRYQLEGVDPRWVEAGTDRSANYTNLRGGNYTFRLRAFNVDGGWTAPEATFSFAVERRLSEAPWFLPLVAALLLASGFTAHAWRSRSLRYRAARLELAVAERTLLLSEARDSLEQRVQERTEALAVELAARQRLEEQLVQARLLERVGRLAGGVAHDLNNLMTAVLGVAELVDARSSDAMVKDSMSRIRVAGERAVSLTQRLLGFARKQFSQPKQLDAGAALKEMIPALRLLCRDDLALHVELAEKDLGVYIDPLQLEQVVTNLVANARDALPKGGTIQIAVERRALSAADLEGLSDSVPGEYVEVCVVDHGEGMSEEVRQHLFEPFFTTKQPGQGTGLGLASCWGIVMQNHGSIRVDSAPGRGTTVSVLLPHAAQTQSRAVS